MHNSIITGKYYAGKLSVSITKNISFLKRDGIEVDKPLLKNGKIGNFYIKETDTG